MGFAHLQAEVVHGVLPDPAWAQRSDRVLEHSLLSLGGVDLETYRAGDASTEVDLAACREYVSLFNSNWAEGTVRHYCCKNIAIGEQPARLVPCCTSLQQTRSKMKAAARKLLVPLFARCAAGATKKWMETSRATAITSFFSKCHGFMKTGSQTWRRRKRRAANDDDDELSEVRATDDPRKRRRKREAKAGLFWARANTPDVVTASAIVTRPLRQLLSHMFSSERNARIYQGGPEVRERLVEAGLGPPVDGSYTGAFVSPGGFIDKARKALLDLLDNDVLCDEYLFELESAEEPYKNELFTRHRGMVLRVLSAFMERISDPLLRDASFEGLLRANEDGDEQRAHASAQSFMDEGECCAEALFVLRMQKVARAANPVEPLDFLLGEDMKQLMLSLGNMPPIMTICLMETLHACFVNRFRAKGFARTGPISVVQDQSMVRWKATVDQRLLAEIAKLKPEQQHAKKSNQYQASHSMIGQIHEEVC